MVKSTVLPNGIQVITAEMPSQSVCFGIFAKVGSRHETNRQGGLSHFLEHILFQGTSRRTPLQIARETERMGDEFNAYTAEEHTNFEGRALPADLNSGIDLAFDMFLHPKFSEPTISKERKVIMEEISMYAAQPDQKAIQLLQSLMWPRQAIGREITGTHDTIRDFSALQLQKHHSTYYVANNTVVVFSGNIKHGQALDIVRKYGKEMRTGVVPAPRPTRTYNTTGVTCAYNSDSQAQIALGFPTFSAGDPRNWTLKVLNGILGETSSSRLFQRIRQQEGMAYSIGSYLESISDAGFIYITMGLDVSKIKKAVSLTLKELQRLKLRPPGHPELERMQEYLCNQHAMYLERVDNRMSWAGEQAIKNAPFDNLEQTRQALRSVTPKDIQQMANELFRSSCLKIAVVGPIRKVPTFLTN